MNPVSLIRYQHRIPGNAFVQIPTDWVTDGFEMMGFEPVQCYRNGHIRLREDQMLLQGIAVFRVPTGTHTCIDYSLHN